MNNLNSDDKVRGVWLSQSSEFISISPEELRQASNRMTRRIFWRNLREYLATAFVVAIFGYYFYKFPTVLLRLGCGLIVVGSLLMVFQLYRNGSATSMAKGMNSKSCVDFHRAELLRQRDLLLSVWKWYLLPFVPGMCVFLLGLLQMVLQQPASRFHYGLVALWFGVSTVFLAGVFALVGKLNQMGAKKLQKEIDALDAVKIEP